MKEPEPGRPRRRAVSAESWHQGETILHALTAAVTFLSPDHRVIWMNQRGLKILGLSPREIEGALCFEIWQNRSIPCPNCPLNEVVRSGQTKEVELTTADSRVWNVRSHPVFDDRGQVTGVVEVRQEITERKKMELAWKESEERFQALFERSLLCVYIHDLGGRFLEANEATLQLLGFSREELASLTWTSLLDEKQLPLAFKVLNELLQTGRQREPREFRLRTKSGRQIWVETEACLLPRKEGLPLILGVAHDISHRKKMEEQLLNSLREKEVLLREVHHRVKNNLQVISSLLDLRAMRAEDEKLRELCHDARSKIQTMALIHTHIYQSGEFSKIAMKNYLRDLVHYLTQIHSEKRRFVEVKIEGEEIRLSVTQAMPLALVLNEAIANAFKHAFPPGQSGTIVVTLKKPDPSAVKILVKDDGLGLPAGIDLQQTPTLGWKLIRNLVVDQLRGRVEVLQEKGTEVIIEFPLQREEKDAKNFSG